MLGRLCQDKERIESHTEYKCYSSWLTALRTLKCSTITTHQLQSLILWQDIYWRKQATICLAAVCSPEEKWREKCFLNQKRQEPLH